MKESDIQRLFGKQIHNISNDEYSCVYELKICKGTSLPFDAVKKHQVDALLEAESTAGVYHKINDMPFIPNSPTRFANPKPFDCFVIRKAKAYVVICFYEPRVPKKLYFIPIIEWLKAATTSERKSINKEMAEYWSEFTHILLNL